MNIIIDGYNLIKQLLKKTVISEKERTWFHQKAVEYSRRKNHILYIVYDGGPLDRPTKEKHGIINLIYSGNRLTADDVIKSYLEEKIFVDMLLVTTDRQLTRFALANDVPTIDSLDFYEFMKTPQSSAVKKKSGELHKLRPEEESPDLDILMEEGARTLSYKQEEQVAQTKEQKASKKERLIEALLRKL
jgi:predicted RNA-binding protein with PIN domain